jgi:hypothetical protein
MDSNRDWLDDEHRKCLRRVGTSPDDKANGKHAYYGVMVRKITQPVIVWEGVIGPGVIFMDCIIRESHPHAHYISDLTKSIYESKYNLENLKHIWVLDVKNEDTLAFIKGHIYTRGTECQYPRDAIITWASGYPQFNALLGTPLGKVVGYFLLSSFGQGVKHIARVSLYKSGSVLQLQFDIEDVSRFVNAD